MVSNRHPRPARPLPPSSEPRPSGSGPSQPSAFRRLPIRTATVRERTEPILRLDATCAFHPQSRRSVVYRIPGTCLYPMITPEI